VIAELESELRDIDDLLAQEDARNAGSASDGI